MTKRKPGRPRTEPALRAAISQAFANLLKKNNWSRIQAATELKVSRQSIYEYIKGTDVPGMDILHRAYKFGLEIEYKGQKLTRDSFKVPSKKGMTTTPRQLLLKQLRNEDLEVRISKQTESTLELVVQIKAGK